MRKIIAALAVALLVSGCATLSNPFNRNRLSAAESGYGILLSAAVGYKRLCIKRVQTVYPKCREVVPQLQAADRKVQGALAAARTYVAAHPNDTIGSFEAISAVQQALADFRAVQDKFGVK